MSSRSSVGRRASTAVTVSPRSVASLRDSDPQELQREGTGTATAVPASVTLVRLQVLLAAVRAVEGRGAFAHLSPSLLKIFVGRPADPLGEALALGALGVESAHHPLDVVGQTGRGGLQAAHLLAEGRADLAAQVDLEALHLVAV